MKAIPGRREALVTLPSDHEIAISREFDAPPTLVYRAWTRPELVRRWWSARRGDVVSIEIDLRLAGSSQAVRDLHLELMGDGLDDALDLFEETVAGLVAEPSQDSPR
jgi:uncharacterized protein YndB with AHSA1/START domain